MLGNQIADKPINYAILQMQFSEKRASKRIMNMLATARDHAVRYKNLDLDKLVVGTFPVPFVYGPFVILRDFSGSRGMDQQG
jgi:hypothetical protein